ncbi:HIT domain-containing protein [Rubinisphaera margarita]|uniref:HIT domain-containing protein n=1 Tax=Rubinisphaera margarita TaxID=2909586 RepID=UPI001EE8EFE0|nr:HIT domain-containing protein [Rubinisphaera margarita]MCG6156285.1 HIT domain-containing protein [Rubinisphaera margarita]
MHIHPQLLQDCHALGHFQACHLLLHRNAIVPWFILVPATDAIDLLDLSVDLRTTVLQECECISRYLKDQLEYPKVNFAALGNVVPQLHIHVIGRKPADACWPAPVWGNLKEAAEYKQSELDTMRRVLQQEFALQVNSTAADD